MMTDVRRSLAVQLFEVGAVRFGAFRLKLHDEMPDAPLSPIYIDLRILRSYPEVMSSAVRVYKELTSGLQFDLYADVPTAATPIVAILSYESGIPMISPRKDKKERGISREIDGAFKQGQTVLLVDDLITLAHSKQEAISTLEQNSLIIRDVVVLLDREQGGVQELENAGYACHSGFKLTQLVEFYLRSRKITKKQFEETIEYLKATQDLWRRDKPIDKHT